MYQVDLRSFKKNSSININEVVKEVTEGAGYYILKGLFEKDDVEHARQTILYLISKQGKKATHFQVRLSLIGTRLNSMPCIIPWLKILQ